MPFLKQNNPAKEIKAARYTAKYPDDFVVFFIGARINKFWRVDEWVPVVRAAFAMVKEAKALPNSPLLESRTMLSAFDWRVPVFIQFWRSFDELEAWANSKDLLHRPAQSEFFRRTAFNGNVGVFHETFRVKAGEYEAIYANMPRILLASAGEYVPVRPTTARDRFNTR
ncbi:DUF4188 domain-containing protein [Nocardia sp. PE-7]|uniref:DUF4188 domain-containing protein n=1 Tax=Nocardia sp. PE-7 TaxID=3058426 RepID=UPI0026598443|nr:DUF4188 domain-containing protein [Nocardia sp. PE-7]WKG13096.1 DUF4188 domain-containing protein [Nocardia sp. PE-7]